MKYRTRKEIGALSMAQVLVELDALHIEPTPHTLYPLDAGHDAQGVPRVSMDGASWLNGFQQEELCTKGSTAATLQQQVEHALSLDLWRHQLYSDGVEKYVSGLGLSKCLAQLKLRKLELSVWEGRRADRHAVEQKLISAIHNETEKEEPDS